MPSRPASLKPGRPGRKTVIFIVGPTGVGKTGLAIKLAGRIGGEIVSCDSMQVYKSMPILSQAPTRKERALARHHLVSVLDPSRECSVALFRKMAVKAIGSIAARGKTPIVTGGTGLYAKALIDGLFPAPAADLKFRRRMEAFASRNGRKRLWSKLRRIDPASAGSIHPNDTRRVIRALEIFHSTGKTMTELKSETKGLGDNYDIRIFGMTRPRGSINKAIDERVDKMLRSGLLAEVKRLKKRRLSRTAAAALGLKEISRHLDGECDLDEARAELKMNTRRFAKRQMTWFGADGRIVWFDMSRTGESKAVSEIAAQVKELKM